jgi:hypothetical protein
MSGQGVEDIQTQIYFHCGVVLNGHEKPTSATSFSGQGHHIQIDEGSCARRETLVQDLQRLVAAINDLALRFQRISWPEDSSEPHDSAASEVSHWFLQFSYLYFWELLS